METREIKFRAWNSNENQWVSYYHISKCFVEAIDCVEFRADDNIKLMQYTGLKDKNGKEIYEGDIVISDYDNSSCVCEWNNEFMCYMFRGKFINKNTDEVEFELGGASYKRLEVIGDIYENPELLKP